MQNRWPQKSLLLIVMTTILPIVFLSLSVFFGMTNTYQEYQSTSNEIKGVKAIQHLFHMMTDLQRIRGLHYIGSLEYSDTADQQLKYNQSHINADLANKNWLDLRAYFDIENDVLKIHAIKNQLIQIENDKTHLDKTFNAYTDLINKILYSIFHVANKSQLILDSDLETYYLMDVAVNYIPEIVESIAVLRGHGGSLLAKGIATKEDASEFERNTVTANNIIYKIRRARIIIDNMSSGIKEIIDKEVDVFESNVLPLLKGCINYPCKLTSNITAELYFNQVSNILSGFSSIFNANTELLIIKLQKRLDKYYLYFVFTVAATLCTVIIILLTAYFYRRQQNNIYKTLEKVAVTDSLTNIPNRRLLEPEFARQIQQAMRDSKGMAFGLMDIDNFKLYNDTYGHSKGDATLQKVAESIKFILQRGIDHYFRYGGEEFCFFFCADSQEEVEIIVNHIRKSIENIAIEHINNLPYSVVTVSIGTVFCPNIENTNIDSWIKKADNMLYLAKDNGRNRCEFMIKMDGD